MVSKAPNQLSPSDLEMLVVNKARETRTLEFKRDMYGGREADRKEFAADVSAMSNSAGGTIIIGIEEHGGCAHRLVGVDGANLDADIRRLESILRDGVNPRLPNVQIAPIQLAEGKFAIAITAPRSWIGPHQVTLGGHDKFYVRHDAHKNSMDIDELREAFRSGDALEAKIRHFRNERIGIIQSQEGPLPLIDGPLAILHLLPQVAFLEKREIVFRDYGASNIFPMGARSGSNSAMVLEGQVHYTGAYGSPEPVSAYTTQFRNGPIEGVVAIHDYQKGERRYVALKGLEEDLLNGVAGYLKELSRTGFEPPVYLALTLVGVLGCRAVFDENHDRMTLVQRRNVVAFPEFELDETKLSQRPETIAKPVFDMMWNAFGFSRSFSYDEKGDWNRR